jgi:hypothetical protein
MVLQCRRQGWGSKTGKVCEFVGGGGCGGKVTVAAAVPARSQWRRLWRQGLRAAAATAVAARSQWQQGHSGGKVTVAARSQWRRRRQQGGKDGVSEVLLT